ncbi:MAG TPA: hypothetical protein VL995_11655 [Cellvibrio sp.]|nr:hypothetical protein [Cellvibrio sp.]
MKYFAVKIALLIMCLSFNANALIFVDIKKDIAVDADTSISADMTTYGFDSRIDRVIQVDLYLYFRELNDDSNTDMPGDPTSEFVSFGAVLFGERLSWVADMDTGIHSMHRNFFPTDGDTCMWIDEFDNCVYDPLKTGQFGIGIHTAADTLWLDEVRWEVEVIRTHVDESASLALFCIGLCLLGLANLRDYKKLRDYKNLRGC